MLNIQDRNSPKKTYRLFRDKLKRLSFSANEAKSNEHNMAMASTQINSWHGTKLHKSKVHNVSSHSIASLSASILFSDNFNEH